MGEKNKKGQIFSMGINPHTSKDKNLRADGFLPEPETIPMQNHCKTDPQREGKN